MWICVSCSFRWQMSEREQDFQQTAEQTVCFEYLSSASWQYSSQRFAAIVLEYIQKRLFFSNVICPNHGDLSFKTPKIAQSQLCNYFVFALKQSNRVCSGISHKISFKSKSMSKTVSIKHNRCVYITHLQQNVSFFILKHLLLYYRFVPFRNLEERSWNAPLVHCDPTDMLYKLKQTQHLDPTQNASPVG